MDHPLPLFGWDALVAAAPFEVILADPPWSHYGSPDKWAAAGKHYGLLSDAAIKALPVAAIAHRPCVVFLWCTSATLERAMEVLRAWGLHYRGVAFVWLKTRRDGVPIGAQGVRPSITKPLTEFVIAGSSERRGRPLKLASEAVSQTVFAPRTHHSAKPEAVQDAIETMYPTARRAELFARRRRPGWMCWGNQVAAL